MGRYAPLPTPRYAPLHGLAPDGSDRVGFAGERREGPPCTRLVAIGDVIEARGGADYAGCRIGLDRPNAEGSWLRPRIAAHEQSLYDDYGRTNIVDGV